MKKSLLTAALIFTSSLFASNNFDSIYIKHAQMYSGSLITGIQLPLFSENTKNENLIIIQPDKSFPLYTKNENSLSDFEYENCFISARAIPNLTSLTVDIRLEKLSCSLTDKKTTFYSNIKGWVLNENGIPGLSGDVKEINKGLPFIEINSGKQLNFIIKDNEPFTSQDKNYLMK